MLCVKMASKLFGRSGESVPIMSVDKEGELVLNEEGLARILRNEKIRDKRLMIVSVCGTFRKGKSFLLTYFLRYLRENGQTNKNWLGLRELLDGFHWRGGKKPDTTGIVMWDEPILIKDDTGGQTAILLMDTQGLFDNSSSKKLCTAIFAFSTLLSSVQVYNVSTQIQADHLEYFEFFTSYTKSMAMQEVPFQKLLFLIRDWSNPEDHDYGLDRTADDGRKSYLEEVFDERKKIDKEDVGKNLRKSFEQVDCFLMPYPGTKVAVSRKINPFRGNPEDIDKEFKVYAEKLCSSLFEASNAVPKKINGRIVCGDDLLNYAIACGRNFKSGDLPEISSMKMAASIALCIKISDTIVQEYEGIFTAKLSEEVYLERNELEKLHEETVSTLIKKFQDQVGFADDEAMKKYSAALSQRFNQKYKLYCRLNELEKGRKQKVMAEAIFEYLNEFYRGALEAKNLHGEEWEQKLNGIMSDLVKKFDQQFRGYPTVDEFKTDLENKLKASLDNQKRKKKEEKPTVHNKDQARWVEAFRSRLVQIRKKYVDANILEEECDKAMKRVSEAETRNLQSLATVNKMSTAIEKTLSEEKQRIMFENERKKEFVTLLFENEENRLLTHYMQTMEEGMKNVYVIPSVLEEAHAKTKKMLQEKLQSNKELKREYHGEILWKEFDVNLTGRLDQEFPRYVKQNEADKELYPQQLTKVEEFFINALAIVIALIGAPIAVALGIPALIGFGIFKAGEAAVKKLSRFFKRN